MNEHKFTGKAEVYDKARPGYPADAIDYILSFLPKQAVGADIGSGTGRLTELLLKRGCKVFSVEPNLDMRAVADQRLGSFGPVYNSVSGTAENTLLTDGAADFVTVAQALHWFDVEKFAIECKRILKPGGKAYIIYNKYIGTNADAYEAFLYARCTNFKGLGGGETKGIIQRFFAPDDCICKQFFWQIEYSQEQFITRALSSSYTPKPGDANSEDFIKELKSFFQQIQKNGKMVFDNITSVYHK